MEDFGEVFKRYIPRSELESLLAESRAAEKHQSEVSDQTLQNPGQTPERKSPKDEPGGTDGSEAAAS